MKHLGIEVPVKNVPELDPGFLPLGKFCTAFLKDAKKPLDIAVERAGGEVAVYKTFIHGTPDMAEADIYYVDRIIKMLLWMKGGFKVYLSGDQAVYEAMKATYCVGGAAPLTPTSCPTSMRSPLRWCTATRCLPRRAIPRLWAATWAAAASASMPAAPTARCPPSSTASRYFRGGGLVPQDHLRPRLPL